MIPLAYVFVVGEGQNAPEKREWVTFDTLHESPALAARRFTQLANAGWQPIIATGLVAQN